MAAKTVRPPGKFRNTGAVAASRLDRIEFEIVPVVASPVTRQTIEPLL